MARQTDTSRRSGPGTPETSGSPDRIACRTGSSSEGPGTYSLTMYGRPSATPVAMTLAVQNAATLAATSASRRKRRRITGSAAGRACSTLIATSAPPGDSPR
ncbi:hypothetical protein GCM10018952_38330 [Streptosporangium vulgare]